MTQRRVQSQTQVQKRKLKLMSLNHHQTQHKVLVKSWKLESHYYSNQVPSLITCLIDLIRVEAGHRHILQPLVQMFVNQPSSFPQPKRWRFFFS